MSSAVRSSLALLALAGASLLFSGCGYVHFGRLPEAAPAAPMRDSKSAEAYTNLSTEHKILKQELALARKEGDTLRTALERASGGGGSDLAKRLAETSAELATLRASYAQLQIERSAGGTAAPVSTASMRELEEKLAASLRDYTQLKAENSRLEGELGQARRENADLAQQLSLATARYGQAQAEVAQLNTELVAQRQARTRSEQVTESLRSQLSTIMAQAAATGTSPLQLARAPSSESAPTGELRANAERIRMQAVERANAKSSSPAPAAAASPATAGNTRIHAVRTGDTLENLAQRYLGSADRWRVLFEANSALLAADRTLRPGMELVIPEK